MIRSLAKSKLLRKLGASRIEQASEKSGLHLWRRNHCECLAYLQRAR